jgi:hypothetical protein
MQPAREAGARPCAGAASLPFVRGGGGA